MCCLRLKTWFLNLFSSTTNSSNFYYIPKDATQQELFLSKYPEFDGRGIKIAIIDSGLDVSLEGLQKTSEGLPKIIDCFDFTGVGDVETSVVKEADSKNILIGLSGRKLKIPKAWINPSGKWHLGLKSLYKPTMSKAEDGKEKLPEIDCIVWYDGTKWMACIETFGNLKKAKVLTNFRDEHEYGIFCLDGLQMAYCITVHNDGNLLEIFTPYDHHGSIVAQMAAANFPDEPEKNGLAPGAQIIFMSIVDPREGYSQDPEKMHAAKKALLKCIEMKVDVINYSLAGFFGNQEMEQLINELIYKCNTLFIKSAANGGPFYATVERYNSNIENEIFTIGAIITSETKKWVYNVPSEDADISPPVLFDFSSRGPGAMATQGLDFTAPGAVFADVPRFCTEKNLGFSGTSYSSPNAAGSVACLLSALKSKSIAYSPFSIKFALSKTAYLPENRNKFEFGHGIIQINEAFDYYCNHKIDYDKLPRYLSKAGGIYFGQSDDENHALMEQEINLSHFMDMGNLDTSKWTMKLSSKAENFLEISQIYKNSLFKIKVSTKELEPGSLNFAEILIMDPIIGSIFNIPVNVVYGLTITETHNYRIQKQITLNFENPFHMVLYPDSENIKKCEIIITALEDSVLDLCVKYSVSGETERIQNSVNFIPKIQTQTHSISIENNQVHEFCFYQKIGSPPKTSFSLEFYFMNDQQ